MWNINKQNQRLQTSSNTLTATPIPAYSGSSGKNKKKQKRKMKESTKRQLTTLGLVFALMGAVYLNWVLETGENEPLSVTETLSPDSNIAQVLQQSQQTSAETDEVGKNYGDSLFVSASGSNSATYFAEARLDRTKARDEALDAMQLALSNANMTYAEKEQLTAKLTALTAAITTESRMENQIQAAGFADCVVFLSENSVKIVVQAPSEGLTAAGAAQIKEIVLAETNLGADRISIVEIPA